MRSISLVVMGFCMAQLMFYAYRKRDRRIAIFAGVNVIAMFAYIYTVNQ